jgi:hypothetical protein
MTSWLALAVTFVGFATAALLRVFRNPPKALPASKLDELNFELEAGRRHATYVHLICDAMSSTDFRFLTARGPLEIVRRTHKERQRIAALYLGELRREFLGLLRLARAVAALSPKVRAVQEAERVWLAAQFFWRYHAVRLALYSGLLLLPQLCTLSVMVSELAVGMEEAVKALGERAAIAVKVTSPLDRRGLDLV